jgi:anoctamin-10/anoctamin-7
MVFKAGSPKVMVRNDENRKVSQEVLYRISTSQTLARVRRAGLKTKVFRGSSGDRFFCLIGATEKRLEEEAHRVEYELELDAHEVIAHGRAQNLRLFRASHSARFVDEDDLLAGGFRLFGKYDGTKQELRPLYSQPRNEGKYHLGTVFRTADRLKLTLSILEGDIVAGGAGLSINTLVKDPAAALRACFPLHQPRLRERLSRQWLRIQSVFSPPLREIRDYMGEKVAFYFSYLSHYNVWLMLPALIGVVFFMMQLSEGTVDIKAVPIFSMFITLWSSLFLESWRRQEAKLRAQWGMVNFVQRERTRAEFVGAVTRSPIDGTVIRDFSLLRKTLRVMFSYSVISALLMVIVSSVIGVFFLRAVLLEWSPSAGSVMTALINALQIQLSNVGYGRLSARLNDYGALWLRQQRIALCVPQARFLRSCGPPRLPSILSAENHRTDTQYENALIAKNFLFKFVNSYNSLFYVAFLKKHDTSVGGCVVSCASADAARLSCCCRFDDDADAPFSPYAEQ